MVRNGEWSYPLIPRKSPVFLSKSGIYTFPDLSHEDEQQTQQQQPQQQLSASPQQPRHSVAIVLDSSVSEANRNRFKEILEQDSLLRREGDGGGGGSGGEGQQRTMTEAAVLKGAEMIGKGIVIGAKVAEYGMQKGAQAAQKYMEPEPGKPVSDGERCRFNKVRFRISFYMRLSDRPSVRMSIFSYVRRLPPNRRNQLKMEI